MNWVPELLDGRLSLRRRLGAGAFGTVYEAVDAKFGGRVAVKILKRDHAQAIYRFKREFRTLADVIHPNLVRLYELHAVADALYFTMELVEGGDLLAHLTDPGPGSVPATLDLSVPQVPHDERRPAPVRRVARDLERVRAAFLELASGVQALHDAGKLHCDIKPSNVLVSLEGRVVLVDFGLVANLDGDQDRRRGGMGTPGYSAPEQMQGSTLGPAADWYSIGAMLHEALTGELPPPSATRSRVEGELLSLARDLLEADASARPSGAEVRRRLGGSASVSARRGRPTLFGRTQELAALRAASGALHRGAPVLVRVAGASGMGKTTLVESFLEELEAQCLVLRGKCYEQDSVPYKALDAIVDALAQHLRQLGPAGAAAMMPPNAGLLERLFPVLRDSVRGAEGDDELDSREQRRRAFLALRELLDRVAQERPVVCFLDDVQWGDVDSARLLVELLRPPNGPRVLVILGHRYDETSAFLATFDATPLGLEERTLRIGELSPDDAAALAAQLLVDRRTTSPEAVCREASGNPLFIQELAARANEHEGPERDMSLGELILARVDALDTAARELMRTVALAGQPIEDTIAVRAAALDASASRDATMAVRHTRLVTARIRGAVTVLEPAHDRVRETLVASLPADVSRAGHQRLGDALLELSQPDPERLVHHFQCAGNTERTREFAVLAADRADETFAFERAASFRGLLLEVTPDGPGRWEMHERHGRSLANAGHAHEAADAFERAGSTLERTGEIPEHDARVHVLRRLAGELTLRSGRLAKGMQRMERVLDDVGVRLPSQRAATALAVGRRLRLFARGITPRATPSDRVADRRRLDAIWSACSGITQLNHVVGDALALQYLLEALELGDRSCVVRGLGLESVYEAVVGGGFFRRRVAKIERAMDQLVAETNDPYDRGWATQCKGGAAWFFGDWETCFARCDEAMRIYRDECRGVSWEVALCDAYRLPGLAYLGEIARLSEIVPRAFAAARDRGDLFAANTLNLGQQSLVLLADDRPTDAIEAADGAIAPFPRDRYLGPHYHHLFAVVQAELYRGNGDRAWSAVANAWPDIERAKLLMAQSLRIEIRHLRARAAILGARSHRARTRALHEIALGDAAKIARDALPAAAPTAALIRAGVASSQGHRPQAIEELARAVDGFERAGMKLHQHAARDRLGELLRGPDGAHHRARAAAFMAEQRIKRPEAMIRMLAPGI